MMKENIVVKNTVFGKMEKVDCPVCKGYGNTFSNSLKDKECICKGVGVVWYNHSNGKGVPYGKRIEKNHFTY